MNSPALTWRLRKIGRTWWSSLRVRSQSPWLAPRAPIVGRAAAKPQGLKGARAESTATAPPDRVLLTDRSLRLTGAGSRSWLAASLV